MFNLCWFQFTQFMSVIREMVSRVETEQKAKLQQLKQMQEETKYAKDSSPFWDTVAFDCQCKNMYNFIDVAAKSMHALPRGVYCISRTCNLFVCMLRSWACTLLNKCHSWIAPCMSSVHFSFVQIITIITNFLGHHKFWFIENTTCIYCCQLSTRICISANNIRLWLLDRLLLLHKKYTTVNKWMT